MAYYDDIRRAREIIRTFYVQKIAAGHKVSVLEIQYDLDKKRILVSDRQIIKYIKLINAEHGWHYDEHTGEWYNEDEREVKLPPKRRPKKKD